MTADFAFLHEFIGTQGCSATFYCIFCLSFKIKKGNIYAYTLDLTNRTLSNQFEFSKKVADLMVSAKSKSQKDAITKKYFNTKCAPASKFIEFCHIGPLPEHCLAGAVNYVLKRIHSK